LIDSRVNPPATVGLFLTELAHFSEMGNDTDALPFLYKLSSINFIKINPKEIILTQFYGKISV
jgi:hypothetical protein